MQTQPSAEALRAVFAKLAGDADRVAVLLAMLDSHPAVWSTVARALLSRVPVSLITKLTCEALQVRRQTMGRERVCSPHSPSPSGAPFAGAP